MISTFLFYEEDGSRSEKTDYVQLKLEIRQLLKDKFNRKVLVEIFLDLKKDISGEANLCLSHLYRNLGLHLYAFDALKSRRWVKISRGIQELNELHIEEGYGFIKTFINDRRGVIRKQAQLAIVSLKHEGISYFLDTNKFPISEWQQLKLMDVLRNLKDFQPPRFRRWLTSKNKYVVLFALRLLKFYKQNDANASLIELVKHRNEQIKIEAIDCIREFCVFEGLDTMKSVFWRCSPEIKILLLDAIANLGTDKDITFLKDVENREFTFIVKSKALSAINLIRPGTILPTIDIETHETYTGETLQTDSPSPSIEQVAETDGTPRIEEESAEQPSLKTPDEVIPPESNLDELPDPLREMSTPFTYGWEQLVDTETDDTEIFDLCLMEELQDILAQKDASEDEEAAILPLEFLPLVTEAEDSIDDSLWSQSLPLFILELEIECEIISEAENFSLELNRLLLSLGTPSASEQVPSSAELADGLEIHPVNTHGRNNDNNLGIEEIQGSAPPEPVQEQEDHNKTPWVDVCGTDNEVTAIIFHLEPLKAPATALKSCVPQDSEGIATKVSDYGHQSIFYDFFRNADEESKLILLEEVLAVADMKDCQFLDSLEGDSSGKVRVKAAKIKAKLCKKWEAEPEYKPLIAMVGSASNGKGYKNGSWNESKAIRPDPSLKELQPLEYCFLNINPSPEESADGSPPVRITVPVRDSGTNQPQKE